MNTSKTHENQNSLAHVKTQYMQAMTMSFMKESRDIGRGIFETVRWILRTGEMAILDTLSVNTFCAIIRLLYHSTIVG